MRGAKRKKQLMAALQKTVRKKGAEKYLSSLHQKVFTEIECLKCAGCCQHISPRFKTPDVKRISKFLGIKESVLIANYLHLDEDGDYVTNTHPCPFLGKQNYCSIYECRPGDCRKYPHTDSADFFSYPATTEQNIRICPAVVRVLEWIEVAMHH
jgi:Fe-S-cluster containining protein